MQPATRDRMFGLPWAVNGYEHLYEHLTSVWLGWGVPHKRLTSLTHSAAQSGSWAELTQTRSIQVTSPSRWFKLN